MKTFGPLAAAACGVALIWASAAPAAEPPTEPLLRIETGRHSALIKHIATDAGSRWLATASDDKTLRVWDLHSGELLRTLRPPLGEDREGMLHAVAMSPDGAYIATGGWTGIVWDKSASIYVFQRATGSLVRRIGGLPDAIGQLAWSPDGQYLAAGLVGKHGIRVFRGGDYALVGQDQSYGGPVAGLDFSRQDRLVSSSPDGMLRLYQIDGDSLRQLASKPAPGGKQPVGARFSPDGARIAVGYFDAPGVSVLSAESLDLVSAPETSKLRPDQNLQAVSWSADGRTLYAGGSVRSVDGKFSALRSWTRGKPGKISHLAAALHSITDIRPLAGGGVVYSAYDPAWGIFDGSGQRTRFLPPATADFLGAWEAFRLSPDGLIVRFGFETEGKSPARFNLAGRSYESAEDEAGLSPPLFKAEGIEVKDWKNTTHPTLNGQALKLKPYEMSHSLAVAPDGQSFVLGTEWALRRFDRRGRNLWSQPVPGGAWALNISADGRLLAAAYANGTIRWHRLSDGRELAAFFPHADRKRWVVWTPSGYYDASPGAEDLIGWHLNRGKDAAADFFPASRFRSQFYRPDVIARIFATLDEGEALRLANLDADRGAETRPAKVQNLLPPVVEIVSPEDGAAISAASVTVKYSVRSPDDAPVTALRVRLNGQAVSLPEARNLAVAAAAGARQVTIPLPPQDNEIQLFAENKNGISSAAALRLSWAGAKVEAKAEEMFKPKLYVLAVGVSKYANPDFNLDLAAKDARDFAAVLQQQQGRLYSEVKVRLLTDDKATKDEVLDGLEWLRREVTARDVGMMFLAGHGVNDNTGNYYFLPHNAKTDSLLRTGVAQNDIKMVLNTLAGKVVFFIDTCHSGNALGTGKTRGLGADINAFVNELSAAENGVVVFTAATGRQFSLEDPAWGNGAFTKAVVEGLSGKADYQKTGKITHKGLDYYVVERVKQLTGGKQSPVSLSPAGVTDFPIAVVGR